MHAKHHHMHGHHVHHRRPARFGPFDFPFGPFPGGPGPGGRGGGFGRRASRGDVRAAVLLLLAEEPRNGYALMQELEQRSEGAWRPSPGSIYPALAQLEDEGLIRAQEGGGSGRTFELTDEGRAHVEERRADLGEPWANVGPRMPKEARELGELVRGVAKAAVEVLRSGTDEQRGQAVALLTETRRSLYRILAEEPAEGDGAR
ncbi:MAG TPA: PadR family transcriptional regulator [Solirubrobacteraceae bacterium]|jgi:DNA-binding PadR family transcriptional regulator|nr:PadR family transcriptional regulator [Solirubrobacteraceae bacterium]